MKKDFSFERRLVSKDSLSGRSQTGAVMVIVFLEKNQQQSQGRGYRRLLTTSKNAISDESSLICCEEGQHKSSRLW